MVQARTTPDRTPAGWGRVAQAYDEEIAPFMAGYAEEALQATGSGPDDRVLDVAAGSGALSLAAARRGARVTAIDFAPEMVERLSGRARDEDLAVDARVMDGQDLRFPDASFDAAYSNMGLMFFPSPDQGLQEMRRVLGDGGRVGIVTWNRPQRSDTFRIMFEALEDAVPDLPPPPEPPAAFSLADADDLSDRMRRAGFRGVQVRQVVQQWTNESPQGMWDGMIRSNPVMPGILERVGPENAQRVQEAFIRRVEEHCDEGPVSLAAEAHLATGQV